MAMDFSDLVDAKVAVAAAGALVVGVAVAIKAVDWLSLVLYQRHLDREFLEYEEARDRELRG